MPTFCGRFWDLFGSQKCFSATHAKTFWHYTTQPNKCSVASDRCGIDCSIIHKETTTITIIIIIMNAKVSSAMIRNSPKNAYQARFMLQSNSASANSKRRATKNVPRLVQQMGGMSMVDFLAITLSERIVKEPALKHVYGQLKAIDVIPLEKELLLHVFGATNLNESGISILQKHCELGLMVDPTTFDSFLVEHLQVFYESFESEPIMLECANRFAEIRSAMEDTHESLVLAKKRRSSRSANSQTLNTIAEDCYEASGAIAEEDEEDEAKSMRRSSRRAKRPSLLKRCSSKINSMLS
eukprot:scaffold6397_cov103-Cylindrotheca_fusiformis.AAC.4